MTDRKLAGIIDLIYDAGFNEEVFKDLPGRLASAVNGRSATLQFLDTSNVHTDFVSAYYSDDMKSDYADNFFHEDVWIAAGARAKIGTVVPIDDLIGYDDFAMTSLCNDFFRAHGDDTAHCVGVTAKTAAGYFVLGIQRARTPGAFLASEVAILQSIVPHLGNLQNLRARLKAADAQADLAKGALDRFTSAVFVVRSDRFVAMTNAAGEALVQRCEGLKVRANRLCALDPAADKQLGRAIFVATCAYPPGAEALPIVRDECGEAYRVFVTPMSQPGLALVIVDSPDVPRPLDQAARFYGLTPSETRLAESLLRGETPEAFAQMRGVRISTVRSQVKSLLAKTGTQRQTQLVALLARLPDVKFDFS